MQVNFNSQNAAQNFGMAIHSSEFVDRIIYNRTTPQKRVKLEKIIDAAKSNKEIDVKLFKHNKDSISAAIFTNGFDGFVKYKNENLFTKLFYGGIVGFIEKCSKIADKQAQKLKKVQKNI